MALRLTPLLQQLTIQTKSLELKRLDLSGDSEFVWAQRQLCEEIERQYNARKPVRIIVLKARQLGISTATEGVIFNWSFIQPGTNSLIIAHETGSSRGLFEMTKRYWETWPFRDVYTQKYSTRSELSWVETRSHIKVATAKNLASGRGSTLHAVHASECAFYADAETLMTGLNQTIPDLHGTIVVLESTANGVGNWFHKEWLKATEGESDYVPLFFPWWKHKEYSFATTLSVKSELDADERRLLIMGATYEHIAWRRWAIINKANGDLDNFMQEYPATPDEAFITSGRPIFSHTRLRECYAYEPGHRGYFTDLQDGTVRFNHDRSGNMRIFRRPDPRDKRQDRYFVAGDPSKVISGDPACIQVINRATFEQVAVWHGRVDPITLGNEMVRIGKYFNWATLCPEVEGGGQATIATILTQNYPNVWMHRSADRVTKGFSLFGWSTNYQRKNWCIGTLQRMVIDHSITIHDVITYNQMVNYSELDNGDWGNSDPDVHDDAVMAYAIGVTASRTEPFTADLAPYPSLAHELIEQEYSFEFDDGSGVR